MKAKDCSVGLKHFSLLQYKLLWLWKKDRQDHGIAGTPYTFDEWDGIT